MEENINERIKAIWAKIHRGLVPLEDIYKLLNLHNKGVRTGNPVCKLLALQGLQKVLYEDIQRGNLIVGIAKDMVVTARANKDYSIVSSCQQVRDEREELLEEGYEILRGLKIDAKSCQGQIQNG